MSNNTNDLFCSDQGIYIQLEKLWNQADKADKDKFRSLMVEDKLSGRELKKQAIQVLERLNTRADKNYAFRPANLDPIKSRLKDGITKGELFALIRNRCDKWKGTEQEEYLRPATLFNRTKCEQYVGELPTLEEK